MLEGPALEVPCLDVVLVALSLTDGVNGQDGKASRREIQAGNLRLCM